MKYIISLIFIIVFNVFAVSQTLDATYKVYTNVSAEMAASLPPETIKQLSSIEQFYSFSYNNGISKYSFDTIIEKKSINPVSYHRLMDLVYFKDNARFKILVMDNMDKKRTSTMISSKSINRWTITNNEIKVNTFIAKEAYCERKGNRVYVYFVPEIMIPDGPEDYSGLPGLIVKVIKGSQIIEIVNYKIQESGEAIDFPKDSNIISKDDFEKYKSKKLSGF